MVRALPADPDLDWLRKTAKQRLARARARDAGARLHLTQLELARDYGYTSWRALNAAVDAASCDGRVVDAATTSARPPIPPSPACSSPPARLPRSSP